MWFQFDASDDPDAPGSRECHSLDAVGKVLYLFGGNDQQQRMNAILTLNTGRPTDAQLLLAVSAEMAQFRHRISPIFDSLLQSLYDFGR